MLRLVVHEVLHSSCKGGNPVHRKTLRMKALFKQGLDIGWHPDIQNFRRRHGAIPIAVRLPAFEIVPATENKEAVQRVADSVVLQLPCSFFGKARKWAGGHLRFSEGAARRAAHCSHAGLGTASRSACTSV